MKCTFNVQEILCHPKQDTIAFVDGMTENSNIKKHISQITYLIDQMGYLSAEVLINP